MQGDVGQNEDDSRGSDKNIPRKNQQDLVTEGKETSLNCTVFISTSSKQTRVGDSRGK